MKKIFTKYGSYLLTLLVVAIVIFSGPAQAITVGIGNLSSSTVREGNNLRFQAKIDLHTDDIITDDINFTLTLSGGAITKTCVFDLQGTNLTACAGFVITPDTNNLNASVANLNYTLYGYGSSGPNQWYNGTTEASYGYGYAGASAYSSTLGDSTALVYNVTWTSPQVSANTAFTIDFVASVTDGTNTATFTASDDDNQETVIVANQGGGGSSGSSNNRGRGNSPGFVPGPPAWAPASPLNFNSEEVHRLKEAGMLVQYIHDTVKPGQAREFTFGQGSSRSGTHTMTMKETHFSVNPKERFAVVEIASTPQEVTVFEGESLSVDLDGDGIYDIMVTADDITQEQAMITLSEIQQDAALELSSGASVDELAPEEMEVIVEDTAAEDDVMVEDTTMEDNTVPPAQEPESSSYWWVYVLVILLVIVGVAMFLLKRGETPLKRKGPKKPSKPSYEFD